MSWIQKLYDTYESCNSDVGKIYRADVVPLLPIAHTTQKAQIEIVIDDDGNFKRADVIGKDESRTIIPCTESSGGRTSKPVAHPLSDKLQYVAPDYEKYVDKGVSYYDIYHKQLADWCASEYSHWKIRAVLSYTEKGTVIKNLIENGILFTDDAGKLLRKWDKNQETITPLIFSTYSTQYQGDSFIRWRVEKKGYNDNTTWSDSSLCDAWILYYTAAKKEPIVCYVSGENKLPAEMHPAKIRNDADKAKLISANDSTCFTYRGRFIKPNDVCNLSFEVTNKAHNALRWLISKQGSHFDTKAIVAWATSGADVPNVTEDTYSLAGFGEFNEESTVTYTSSFTAENISKQFNARMKGYSAKLGDLTDVIVMGVDAATPGRLSIIFYRELSGSDFIDAINYWHSTCIWKHDYIKLKGGSDKEKKVSVDFIGAPAPRDIAEAAYGLKIDAKLKAATVERLLPCIIDNRQLPIDLVESAVSRASCRTGKENWEWNKTLSIACALYKKYNYGEDYQVALDENRDKRDYLYGRLLAVADVLEGWALSEMKEKRQTNAARLMQRFADHPFSTWRIIELALDPYKAKLGQQKISRFLRVESQIMNLFDPEQYSNDKKLTGEFLLGYHCQRDALYKSNKELEDVK